MPYIKLKLLYYQYNYIEHELASELHNLSIVNIKLYMEAQTLQANLYNSNKRISQNNSITCN